MKPGTSRASATVLPIRSAASRTAAAVASAVSSPRITSTRGISGTGLKKCMPTTAAGRDVLAASRVIGIELVFDARIAPSCATSSSCLKISA